MFLSYVHFKVSRSASSYMPLLECEIMGLVIILATLLCTELMISSLADADKTILYFHTLILAF